VNRKIKNCQELVDNATSEDQKKIYRGYLDFWKNWKAAEKKKPKEVIPEKIELLEVIDEVPPEAEFKRNFPNKQAYYSRNGEMHMTKAFKEYLNKTE
jgi:deoxyribodipyrimidine photolyase